MAWQPDELDRIGGTQELQISTYRDVALEPAADPATNADIDAAYRAKYRGHGSSLRTMIEAPASATSLRLADPTG